MMIILNPISWFILDEYGIRYYLMRKILKKRWWYSAVTYSLLLSNLLLLLTAWFFPNWWLYILGGKSASFVVQAIAFKQTSKYVKRQSELRDVVSTDECGIIETFLSLKSGGKVDFYLMSEALFAWSKKWITEND